jgi:hypothetical protein
MPKSSKRRTVSPDTGVRERFDARISVGHVRRPVLEGETATHNTLSTLLGALGGTGPIRQKLQQERDVREARKARVAVDEGKTLDEVDSNFITEAYFHGFKGQQLGADAIAKLQQDFQENENNPEFNPAEHAQNTLLGALSDIENDDQAHNAANVIRSRTDEIVQKEVLRRQEEANLAHQDLARDGATQLARGIANTGDGVALAGFYEQQHADMKHSPSFTPRGFRKWVANDLVAHAVEFGNPEILKEAAMVKNPVGATLWTDPIEGPRLRKMYTTLRGQVASADAFALGTEKERLDDMAKKGEVFDDDDFAPGRRLGISESALGSFVKTSIDVRDRHLELDTNNVLMAGNEPEGVRLGQTLSNKDFSDGMDRLRSNLVEYNDDPALTDSLVGTIEAQVGRVSAGSQRIARQNIMSTQPQNLTDAMALARTYEKHNPSTVTDLLGEGGQARFDLVNVLEGRLGLTMSDITAAMPTMAEGLKNARAVFAERASRGAVNDAIRSNNLTIAGHHGRVKSLATALLATGHYHDAEGAADAAAAQVAEGMAKVGTLGSRLNIDAADIDPALGNQEFYNAYETQTIDFLRDPSRFPDPKSKDAKRAPLLIGNLADPDDQRSPGERDFNQRLNVWPRRDGTTWVYNENNMLMAIVETAPILEATHAVVTEPRAKRAAESAAANALRIQGNRAAQDEFGNPVLF